MLRNVYFGWWVLGRELLWVFGQNRSFRRQQKLLRDRQAALQNQLASETLTAGTNREKLMASLQLVESDLRALVQAQHAAHLSWLRPLCERFPECFTSKDSPVRVS